MAAVTLQPAAGAHGELTGILMIRAYHRSRGRPRADRGPGPGLVATAPTRRPRRWPASGRSRSRRRADGGVDLDAFRAALGPRTAAIMITNPSTLGLFERRIGELLDATHEAGALAYMDGANLNAILGRFKPGEAGFDVMHFNTHKTFSTPHGGGGPGAGPVGVLRPPRPVPARAPRPPRGRRRVPPRGRGRAPDLDRPDALVRRQQRRPRARVRVPARARRPMACARSPTTPSWRPTTSRRASARRTTSRSTAPCKHEFVASASDLKQRTGVRTLDVAKRLIDKGYHPPTIYFPLTVEEGMLIEPTETESLETLDALRRRADRDRPRGRRRIPGS